MLKKYQGIPGDFMKRVSSGSMVVLSSLMLSLIAVVSDPVINRDGILYIHTAETLARDGLKAALDEFNWPFFSALIAGVSSITLLDFDLVAYLLCFIFIAGLCFFIVKISDRLMPGTAWVAVVVVLCLPALNDYRPYVVRDFGAWFFVFAALYSLLCWREAPSWKLGGLFQTGVGMATLFRPEMVFVFFGVMLAWPWLRRPGYDLRDLTTLFWVCGVASIVVASFLMRDLSLAIGRLDKFLGYLDISEQVRNFQALSEHFGSEVLNHLSRGSAGFILFWGLVAMIPATVIGLLSVLTLPLGYAFRPGIISEGRLRAVQPFPVLALVYVAILVLFLVVKQFMSDRYVVLLVLLLTPLVVEGFRALSALSWSKGWRYFFVVLLLFTAAGSVITTGDRKLYIKAAGDWIRERSLRRPVYFDEIQQRYYAGFEYKEKDEYPTKEELLASGGGEYQSLVLLVKSAGQAKRLENWVEQNSFRQIASFGEDDLGVRILVSNQR